MSLKRRIPKVYTPAERIALVTEIQTRQRLDASKSIDTIARQLGITGPTYFNWLRKGVRPEPVTPAPTGKPTPTGLSEKAARRYSQERRRELVAEIAGRVAEGQPLTAVLAALDLGRTTYRRWLDQGFGAPPFRAVEIAAPESPLALVPVAAPERALVSEEPRPAVVPTLTLVSPGGYRIEGLAVESAAELLRALS